MLLAPPFDRESCSLRCHKEHRYLWQVSERICHPNISDHMTDFFLSFFFLQASICFSGKLKRRVLGCPPPKKKLYKATPLDPIKESRAMGKKRKLTWKMPSIICMQRIAKYLPKEGKTNFVLHQVLVVPLLTTALETCWCVAFVWSME